MSTVFTVPDDERVLAVRCVQEEGRWVVYYLVLRDGLRVWVPDDASIVADPVT